MACFLVSAAEALAVTGLEKHEEKVEKERQSHPDSEEAVSVKIPMSVKLRWLSYFLWGGALLLAFEHIWHGEVVPWFPFLSAMSNPADTAQMLREMATVGVSMAVLITLVWLVMCKVADSIVSRKDTQAEPQV